MNRALIVGAILAAALVSGGMLIQAGPLREAAAQPASPRLFEEVVERLRRDYIDTLSTEQMMRLAAFGVVPEVDERYSMLLPPERTARVRENASGRYAGVGVEVDVRNGFVTVVAPTVGTPADSAGIKPGDHILAIDGKSTYRLTVEEVQQALRGPQGKQVRLSVERDGETRSHALTRRMTVPHAVRRTEILAPGIGYVALAIINEQAVGELRRAIDSLRERGERRGEGGGKNGREGASLLSPLSSLILDLRENPGGPLEQGIEVADLFLDPGQKIAGTRGRTPETNRDFTDGAKQLWPTIPIVVLIDSGTASAAEIVAAALKDNGRGVLVGSTTYGKGSAQSLLPIPGGYTLKLTTARWLTPAGRTIERDSTSGGVEPDVDVKWEAGSGKGEALADPVLRRALELLQGANTPARLRAKVPTKPKKSG